MATRREFLSDILTTALEGGINHWATVVATTRSNGGLTSLNLQDAFTGDIHKVNHDDIERGIDLILADLEISGDLWDAVGFATLTNDAGDLGSDEADAIVQAAIFGDILYG